MRKNETVAGEIPEVEAADGSEQVMGYGERYLSRNR
mgnify:CR=1 FL=1